MNFKGEAKRLDDIDLPRLGYKIGVGEDEIHAILDVETTGSGFDAQGRPRILFEPHVFYRNLTGTKRTEAMKQGLAAKSWGTIPYGKESDQYPRLEKALLIDETAALKACSWGLGQVLGENHVAAGFGSPQQMVEAFKASEAAQLQGMISFIAFNHLDDELRAHNWAAFARGYNGSSYAKNGYDRRLAAAYAKWSKIPDTPWTPPGGAEAPARRVIGKGMRGADVIEWQKIVGVKADGIFGAKTEEATKKWQKAHRLVADGIVGPKTWAAAIL